MLTYFRVCPRKFLSYNIKLKLNRLLYMYHIVVQTRCFQIFFHCFQYVAELLCIVMTSVANMTQKATCCIACSDLNHVIKAQSLIKFPRSCQSQTITSLSTRCEVITKTYLCNIQRFFRGGKNDKLQFSVDFFYFHIFAQNTDCR